MSCNKINTCFRYGTDYQDRLISFPNGIAGLSNFRYEITQRETVINLTVGNGLEIIGEKVCIQGDALESLLPDAYDTVFWLDINGQTRDLFTETLQISIDGCDCANVYNLSFTIIPVNISENVVNIYLSWEDLTPEQILELQQPAIDAGNEVRQQVDEYIEAKELQINPVILAAENATQGANDAAQTANTAAENADEKATAAQTAANNANDATSAANTATTNANDATLAANTAATNAQDEADAAQQINTDIQLAENIRISNENERIGAENDRQAWEDERDENEDERILNESARVSTENTRVSAENTRISNESIRQSQESTRQSNETTRQNQEGTRQTNETGRVNAESARVTAEGNRVTAENNRVIAENQRVINDANRPTLIASYTHSGNLEVRIESVDYVTHTFTKTSHGLVNGDRLGINLDLTATIISDIRGLLPFNEEIPAGGSSSGYFVINATANTFQISTTVGGVAISTISKGTVDFSKWHFEKLQDGFFRSFTGLDHRELMIQIVGSYTKVNRYITVNGNIIGGYGYIMPPGQYRLTNLDVDPYSFGGKVTFYLSLSNTGIFIRRIRRYLKFNTANAAQMELKTDEYWWQSHLLVSTINSVVLQNNQLHNGSVIKIYKL